MGTSSLENRELRPEPPKHAFEVRISIGGDTWDYVRRAIDELSSYIAQRDPEHCGLASGGCGGCHSVDVFRRDVTPEQYHEELMAWRDSLDKPPSPEPKTETGENHDK